MNSHEKSARGSNCDLWDFLSDAKCLCRVVMSLKLFIFKQAHVYTLKTEQKSQHNLSAG